MGLSKQAVFKTMKAALSKLKENLINGALQKRVVVAREATSILGLTRGWPEVDRGVAVPYKNVDFFRISGGRLFLVARFDRWPATKVRHNDGRGS